MTETITRLTDQGLCDLREDYLGMKCSEDIISLCDELIVRRKIDTKKHISLADIMWEYSSAYAVGSQGCVNSHKAGIRAALSKAGVKYVE